MSNQTIESTTTKALVDLGLGENEAKLYEILLKTPLASIPELQKITPFSRTLLYYLLGHLEQYDLVKTEKIQRKTVFIAEHPDKLIDFISVQEKELQRQKSRLNDVLSELNSNYRIGHSQPGVKFFEGHEGIFSALDYITEHFKPNTEILSFVKVKSFETEKGLDSALENFVKKRIKSNVKTFVIAINNEEGKNLKQNDKNALRETRLVSSGNLALDFPGGEFFIYENIICVLTAEKNSHFAFVITSPAISQMFKAFFFSEWSLLNTSS